MAGNACCAAVELFLNRENMPQIQLVFTAGYAGRGQAEIRRASFFSGVKGLSAGPRWSDQIFAGLEKIAEGITHVVLHDAARPAVSYSDIDALLDAAEKHSAVTLATPVRATLAEMDEGGNPIAISHPPRFMQILMPQVFSVAKLKELAAGKREPHASEFTIVKGSPLNVRVGGAAMRGWSGRC